MSLLIYGALGALLPDTLRLIKGRYEPRAPEYVRSFNFWLGLGLSIGLGVVVVKLANATTEVQALACGFSAPEMLTRLLAKAIPQTKPAPGDASVLAAARGPLPMREWWAL